jgi:hypothetical protein
VFWAGRGRGDLPEPARPRPGPGSRVLGEFGDNAGRYASAKTRKNYVGSSPITQQSGKREAVLARFVHNDRIADALHQQAFCALSCSPGARGYWRRPRNRATKAIREPSTAGRGVRHSTDLMFVYHSVAWSGLAA